MVAGGYFTDARRTKIRQKTGVGFIEDYFLRSEISDYRRLRTLVNLIIGVVFCACLYYLGWKNLNFADFHFAYGIIFKWFMIISTAFAFALSPMFRCAMLCVLLGAMGKNGQAPLSLLILENLQDGSITNIVTNYQRTAEILLCHLELQAKIASNRVSMLTGPVEGVLERQLDLGLQMLKDLISTIRSILVPFLAEIKTTRTKEDKKLDERDEQISNLARRKALDSMMMNEKKSEEHNEDDDSKESAGKPKKDDAKPTWAEFKTKIMKRRLESLGACKQFMRNAQMSNTMEGDLNDVVNLTNSLDTELQANLHMMLVEMPRLENVFQVSELKMFVSIGANYVKVVLRTAKQVVEALFVFYVYVIFRDSVILIENYLTDVDYNNCFITSKPTRDEMTRAKTSLITWFITAFSATLLILLDYYLYAFLNAVR
ncbi:unnamed protein product [Angiostrongylus costaricensis]|uniref:DC_STAMP domain-containing protein n=1 Tax=Angiostrongylus costaricensis TaxID=334426 RepID=A0A0R3PPT8_ANGCS|nr:unnamed protein product [Angiostrongylus costaricensis]